MKMYTIVGGVNGAGKSSLTGVLRTELKDLGRIIDVDKLTAAVGGNIIEGGKQAAALIDECLAEGICFTQETTLSGHKTIATAKRALATGYHVRLYYVGLSMAQESIDRIANRVAHGGHDIPAADVLRRFETRLQDAARILPYCHEATFYCNDNGFRAVAEYRSGELLTVGQDIPEWVTQLAAIVNP